MSQNQKKGKKRPLRNQFKLKVPSGTQGRKGLLKTTSNVDSR